MLLRWYQDEALLALFDYFEHETGNPIVALPTGTGKSLVIAEFLRRVFYSWPNQRVMMLTHVKELIEQNAEEITALWPTAPLGIYSAGLKQRATQLPIIFGGVQSVYKCTELFGWRDLVIIDECHLLGPNEDTMYQEILVALKKINPWLKVIGLSATPFRLKQGMLTDGGIFTHICYDMTGVEQFNRLIAEGYIKPLIPKRTNTIINDGNFSIVGGEFNSKEVEREVDKYEVIYSAVKETCELGYRDRQCWLTFGAGISSVEHLCQMFDSFGVPSIAVHSKIGNEENKKRIAAYKAGKYRNLVNMNKFTTGFNHPPIDLIADLQPTNSPGKHVQKAGRGTRPSPDTGKENCLFLDFAQNTRRNGPINDPRIPGKPGIGKGNLPIRICDCGTYNHAAARFCVGCGMEFEFETKIFKSAGTEELIATSEAIIETLDVRLVLYARHEKRGASGELLKAPSIKVTYVCGLQRFYEWLFFEGKALALHKSREWWRQRINEEPPVTTHEALSRINNLRKPRRIRVHVNKQYPEILGYEY